MKLSVCITLFDGVELLDDCVTNYEKICDNIIICYQTTSNTNRKDETLVEKLKPFHQRCTIIKFDPNVAKPIKDNERAKHNYMVNHAKTLGSTHFIMSAVDHFYVKDDFDRVKDDASEYDITFTKIHTYYKKPTWKIKPNVPWVMPFICKLKENTTIKKVANFPVFVDPACQITPFKTWKLYEENEIVLHNYSNVRVDFEKKINNAQLPMLWSKKKKQEIVNQFKNYNNTNESIIYYNYAKDGVTAEEVPNYFNL